MDFAPALAALLVLVIFFPEIFQRSNLSLSDGPLQLKKHRRQGFFYINMRNIVKYLASFKKK